MAPPLASAGTRNSNKLLPYQIGSGRWARWGVGMSIVVCMAESLRPKRAKVKQRFGCDLPGPVVGRDRQRGGYEGARQLRLFAVAPRHRHPRGFDTLEWNGSQLRKRRTDRGDR